MALITRDSDRVLFCHGIYTGVLSISSEKFVNGIFTLKCQSSLINGYGIPKIRLSFKFLRRRTDGALILLIENI